MNETTPMTRIRTWLDGRKTYLVCAAAVLGALLALTDGRMTDTAAVTTIVEALMVAFLRSGVAKAEKRQR